MTALPQADAAAVPQPLSLAGHIVRHLRLAVPVMVARAGLIIMITVDSVMAGHAGVTQLAHYAISLAPHVTLLVLGVGLLVGTVVLTAQADGAGRRRDCGAIWSTSLRIAGLLGLATGALLFAGETVLLFLGQAPELARGGGRALAMFGLGMPAILMYIATSFFLEGIGRPQAGVVVALFANLLNGALNWLLVYGHLGAPEMGAAGAALGTTITRWVMLFALLGYALNMAGHGRYGVRARVVDRRSIVRRLLRIGAPLSLAAGIETACFSLVATFAGRLGETPLAAYQIAFNVVTFVFMLAIGISTAASIRVANAVGRADRRGMAVAGWTGLGLVTALMAVVALLIRLCDQSIAGLYTGDAMVLRLAVPALAIAALLVVADGTQAVLLGALRGVGDARVPTFIYALAFWGLSVPLAYSFGLRGSGGVEALLWSLFAGLVCATVLLGWRFKVVARRDWRPL